MVWSGIRAIRLILHTIGVGYLDAVRLGGTTFHSEKPSFVRSLFMFSFQAFWLPTIDDWSWHCLAICTVRAANRKVRGDWDDSGIDWTGEHLSTWPSQGCAVHRSKELLCWAPSKGLLVLQTQSALSLSSSRCTELFRGWLLRIWLQWGPWALSVLNIFAAEEPVMSPISAHPSPIPEMHGKPQFWFEMLGQLSTPCPHPACLVTGSPCVIVAVFHNHHVS